MTTALPVLRRLRKGMKHLTYIKEFVACFRVFQSPFRMILGYLGCRACYPFVGETKQGSRFVLNTHNDLITAWVVFLRAEYRVCPDDRVIIDCGANIGLFSIFAAAAAPRARIYAIEPFPERSRSSAMTFARTGSMDG